MKEKQKIKEDIMNKLLAFLIMIVTITIPVYGQNTKAVDYDSIYQYGAIAGFVREDSTGLPIAGALITAQGSSYGSAYTDSLGRYRILSLERGCYTVTAQAIGYETAIEESVLVRPGKVTRVDFWLISTGDTVKCLGNDSIPRWGAIAGFVCDDSTGLPISGAQVTAQGPSYGAAYTNSIGRYRILRLKRGVYQVTAEAKGYKTATDDSVIVRRGKVTRVDFLLTPIP